MVVRNFLIIISVMSVFVTARASDAPIELANALSPSETSISTNDKYCAKPHEIKALNIRAMQAELMVAALSCGLSNEYNGFMKLFKTDLTGNSRGIKSYFTRVHGSGAKREMNRFVTNLANVSSNRSLNVDLNEYCNNISQVFFDLKNTGVITREAEFASIHGVGGCVKTAQLDSNSNSIDSKSIDTVTTAKAGE